MRKGLYFIVSICLAFACYSCEDDTTDNFVTGKYSKGVLVVNEGNYNSDNADISFIVPDSSKVYNDIFYSANSETLGDIAQSVAAYGDNYYVVVNNSNKIEVVSKTDFERVQAITGVVQPRYMAFAGGKGYVTQWGQNGVNGSVAVIDLSTYSIEKSISTGCGPEKMVILNNNLYISNSGGYASDSTITIINLNTGQAVGSVKVGYNPKSMVVDKNNKIWVLCGGKWKTDYSGLEKAGSLVCVNPSNNTIERSFMFALGFSQPSSLNLNASKDKLIYQYNNSIFEMAVSDQALPSVPKVNRGFYNISVDPVSGQVYGADPRTYTVSGYVVRYSPSYAIIDSFKVGRVPGEIFFNN